MARTRKSRTRNVTAQDALPDDLYDYARPPARRVGRPAPEDTTTWTVTDDWPDEVPINIGFREIFNVVRFSTFATVSPRTGHARAVRRRLLLRVERTCRSSEPTSDFDPIANIGHPLTTLIRAAMMPVSRASGVQ